MRFSDETVLGTEPFSTYDAMFNDSTSGAVSMYSYFRRASYGTLSLPTYFYPAPSGSTVLSYQDSLPRSYYRPYSATNTNGYNDDDERRSREFGRWIYVDMEIRVDKTLSLENAHAIAHEVHDLLEARFPVIKHVMIHVNPD